MNREALDEFFAKAEDVLTDWEPDPYHYPDVMIARGEDADADLPVADSYYVQPWTDQAPINDTPPPGSFAEMLEAWQRDFVRIMDEACYRSVHVPTVGRSPFDDIRELQRAIEPPPEPRADWQGPDPLPVILDETCGWRHLGHIEFDADPSFALCESPRDRALRLRRERNTGPDDQRGLDGRRRRRGQ